MRDVKSKSDQRHKWKITSWESGWGQKWFEWNVCNGSANWIVIPYEYGSSNLLGLVEIAMNTAMVM